VPPEIVTYQLDDKSTALFEIDPVAGFRPAGFGDVAGRVREASALSWRPGTPLPG
jgi:hypothetical protein